MQKKVIAATAAILLMGAGGIAIAQAPMTPGQPHQGPGRGAAVPGGVPMMQGQQGAPATQGQQGMPMMQGQQGTPSTQRQPGMPMMQGQQGAPSTQGQQGMPMMQGRPSR